MSKAPIVLFVYNRLDKAKSCLNALEKNEECSQTDLYVYADGAKRAEDKEKVQAVRNFIKNDYIPKSKFSKVHLIESDVNKGLSNSIIGGVTEVINSHGKVIVVEDDLIVSTDFLRYMNGALDFYKSIQHVGSVSAYTSPVQELISYKKDVYFLRKGECWGWGTWKDRWENVDWEVSTFEEYRANKKMRREFDAIGYGLDAMLCSYMEGTLDTWATRWCYHLFRNGLLTVYPAISRTNNIGMDGTGEHCSATMRFAHDTIGSGLACKYEVLDVNRKLEKAISFYEAGRVPFMKRVFNRIHSIGRKNNAKK